MNILTIIDKLWILTKASAMVTAIIFMGTLSFGMLLSFVEIWRDGQ